MKLASQLIRKIAVFRALQLGDMLCAVPAFKTLRLAYPDAEICLVGLPWAQSFTDRFSNYFDRFIEFPGYPGLPEQNYRSAAIVEFLASMQREEFDLVIQMQGNGSYVNPMTELFGGKYLAGYYRKEEYYPDSDLFMLYPNYGSEIERHLSLMNHLGLASVSPDLEFPLNDRDQAEFGALEQDFSGDNFICVHPGSRGSWRQWPTKHFAAIADYCFGQGYQIVLTGTESEKSLTEEVEALMSHPAINLAGKTTLGSMGVLISKAAMLVSNCTGVSHMSAAFKTPSIVISMDGEPERWAPLDTSIHKTTNWLKSPDFQAILEDTKSLLKQIKYSGRQEARKTSL